MCIRDRIGTTYFGEKRNIPGAYSQKVKEVKAFLDAYGIPNEVPEDMVKKIWWKFMLNVGINESTAAFRADYGTAQNVPEIRKMTLASMREVLAISDRAGIGLAQSDIDGMMDLLDQDVYKRQSISCGGRKKSGRNREK